jgi:hypothetical protein
MERIRIDSEEDAWNLLDRIRSSDFQNVELLPTFGSWATMEFKFWVGGKSVALTAPVMEAMLEYQKSINRAFMLVGEGTSNLRSLSEEERSTYEALFVIRKGSTKLDINLQELLKEFVKMSVGKLNGTNITIIIVAFALLYAGDSYWKAWLETQKEITISETSSSQTKQILDNQKFAEESDLKKMELMNQAVMAAMGNRGIIDASNDARKSVVRAASKVQDTEIAGKQLPPEVAKPLARSSRTSADLETLTDSFEIVRVDTDVPNGFRVRLKSTTTQESFFASVREVISSENDRKLIQRGEWERKSIIARIHLTRRRGEVASARIDEVLRVEGDDSHLATKD